MISGPLEVSRKSKLVRVFRANFDKGKTSEIKHSTGSEWVLSLQQVLLRETKQLKIVFAH